MIEYLDHCCKHGIWITNSTYVLMVKPNDVPFISKRGAATIRKLLLTAGWGNRGRIAPLAIQQRAVLFLYA